jgi:hypothetical protein
MQGQTLEVRLVMNLDSFAPTTVACSVDLPIFPSPVDSLSWTLCNSKRNGKSSHLYGVNIDRKWCARNRMLFRFPVLLLTLKHLLSVSQSIDFASAGNDPTGNPFPFNPQGTWWNVSTVRESKLINSRFSW